MKNKFLAALLTFGLLSASIPAPAAVVERVNLSAIGMPELTAQAVNVPALMYREPIVPMRIFRPFVLAVAAIFTANSIVVNPLPIKAQAVVKAPELTAEPVDVPPGVDTVKVPIVFMPRGKPIAGLDFKVKVPEGATVISIRAGPVAEISKKSVFSRKNKDENSWNVEIMAFNSNFLMGGTVAIVTLSVPPGTPDASVSIEDVHTASPAELYGALSATVTRNEDDLNTALTRRLPLGNNPDDHLIVQRVQVPPGVETFTADVSLENPTGALVTMNAGPDSSEVVQKILSVNGQPIKKIHIGGLFTFRTPPEHQVKVVLKPEPNSMSITLTMIEKGPDAKSPNSPHSIFSFLKDAAQEAVGASISLSTSISACDLNHDGKLTIQDEGIAANLYDAGLVDANFVATIVNAVLTQVCGIHTYTVTLSWPPVSTPGATTYNIYRSQVSGGPYIKLNATPIAGTPNSQGLLTYTDSGDVYNDNPYYYVVTNVQACGEGPASAGEIPVYIPLVRNQIQPRNPFQNPILTAA